MLNLFKLSSVKIYLILLTIVLFLPNILSAVPSGTLKLSWPATFRSIDPHLHDNQRVFWAVLGPNLFDHLIERSLEGDLVPGLATSWKSVSPKVWEFNLRKGVKFHNGENFNGEAVKFTFERMKNLTAPCLFLFKQIDTVEIINDYKIRIHTSTPYGALPNSLAMAEIVPPLAASKKSFSTHPVGTGPFKFKEWIKGEKFVMTAFENYWGGAPKIKNIVHYPLIEAATRAAAIKTGKVDIIHKVPIEEIDSVKLNKKVNVISVPGNDTIDIVFDHDTKFGDVRIRKAIAYAIDTKEIEEYILGVGGTAAKSIIAPPVFGFKNTAKYWPDYDMAKAKSLLKEAGYPNGFSTNITIPGGFYLKDRDVNEYIKAKLSEIGIDLEIRYLAPASAWPVLDSTNFELFFAGWASVNMDGDMALYRNFHSANTREGFSNSVVDSMLDIGRKSGDSEVRKAAYLMAQIELANTVIRYPLYHPNHIYGVNKRVINFNARSDEVYNLHSVSLR